MYKNLHQDWYRNAIFYSLDVESFYDSTGDGVGDFIGLINKLDYLAGLGITCIWLIPFYPSPDRDNGYDVMDYYNVDPQLGNLGDFAVFIEKADNLGIRIIIDLVVNHTSIQHPWFQEARKNKNSPYHDYYIWSEEPIEFDESRLMFKGEEETVWTYDKSAKKYYLHRFYKEQPDLNLGNEAVREEILKIMGFWLRLGVSGFRIDAAEIMVENYGLVGVDEKTLHDFFNEMLDFALAKKRDALLLAEVNGKPDEIKKFLGKGNKVHMLFNFYLNQYLFLSLVQNKATSLKEAIQNLPKLVHKNLFLNFLRHHDELNLKLLKKNEMKQVFDKLAPEENMRVFGFGIRRRLSPMFDGNQKILRFVYSLMFSLPGIPMIRYGEEIGMGDDLSLEGRESVRTPMQWTKNKNGGFSEADEKDLVHPVINKGQYGYQNINILNAQHDASSLLNWIEKLIITRKQCPEIGYGNIKIFNSPNDSILFHAFEWNKEKLYLLHNFSPEKVRCNRKKFLPEKGQLFEVLSDVETNEDTKEDILINGYGYRWFRLQKL
jgi:maltose alpha-D-glucosyltransferase/alpha-amylase